MAPLTDEGVVMRAFKPIQVRRRAATYNIMEEDRKLQRTWTKSISEVFRLHSDRTLSSILRIVVSYSFFDYATFVVSFLFHVVSARAPHSQMFAPLTPPPPPCLLVAMGAVVYTTTYISKSYKWRS